MKDVLYRWNFSNNKQRGSLWYVIAASISLGLIIWGILTNQYGMSFIILLISGIYFFVENNTRDRVDISIVPEGIFIENSFYDKTSIVEGCFVFDDKRPYYLRISMNKKGLKQLDIHINEKNFSDLQDILPQLFPLTESVKLTFTEKMIILLKL